MTIQTEITRIQTNIANAYTACDNKGATLPQTQNSANLGDCVSSILSGGGTPSETTDVPLTRVSDDNGNEIGTWYMNFEDANDNVFKVILLDAQYRSNSTQWCSSNNKVTNLPLYSNLATSNVYEAKETATANTQLILDYCTASSYTSTACTHCRSKSFTIGGTTYYGQLPNLIELDYLAKHYSEFDLLDASASTSTSTNFSLARSMWSSSQYDSRDSWYLYSNGGCAHYNSDGKTSNNFACPVLEIPNN